MSGPPDVTTVSDRKRLIATTSRLIEFLREIVRTGRPQIFDIADYEEARWLDDLPASIRASIDVEAGPGDVIFSMNPVVTEPAPPPPIQIEPLLSEYQESDSPEPTLQEFPSDVDEEQSVRTIYDSWITLWRAWAEEDRKRKIYRSWFELLSSASRRLDQQDDQFEMVVGTGFISYVTDGRIIRHPLLTSKVELSTDPITGRVDLRVPLDGITKIVDRTLFSGLDGFESAPAEALRDELRNLPATPMSRTTLELLERWRTLSLDFPHHVEFSWTAPDAVSNIFELRFAPLLILRERDRSSLIDYFDRMLESLSGPDAAAPLGLAQLVSAIEAPERAKWLEDEGAMGGDDLGSDPLFPLPANPEQRAIIERLRYDNGVVVQGPPGTGKSHTISNLIAALLARGQRVLVTSQKAQALRVLREKLPHEIQLLCVSMTDLSRGGSSELNESVNALSDRFANFSEAEHKLTLTRHDETRRSALHQVALLKERIRLLREAETVVHPQIAEGYVGTLAQIARVLKKNEGDCAWITLPFPRSAPPAPPLTAPEIIALRRLLLSENPRRSARRTQLLPDLSTIPTLIDISVLIDAEHSTETIASEAATELSERLGRIDQAQFDSIAGYVDRAEAAIHRLPIDLVTDPGSDDWRSRAIIDGLLRREMGVWKQVASRASEATEAQSRLNLTSPEMVTLPQFQESGTESLAGQLLAVREFESYLKSGGQFKKHLRSSAQRQAEFVLEHALVDGMNPTNADSLRRLIIEMSLEQTFRRLQAQWLLVGVQIESNQPLPRRIAQLCDLINDLDSCLDFVMCRDSIDADLESAGIRITLSTTSEWVEFTQAIRAVESRLRAERASGNLRAVAARLALDGQLSTAAPELLELAKAVENRNLASYQEALAGLTESFAEQIEQHRCDELWDTLYLAHPTLAETLRRTISDGAWESRLPTFEDSWSWGRARTYLEELRDPGLDSRLSEDLESEIARLGHATATLAAEEAWGRCLNRMTRHQEQALRSYRANIAERGAGTGKWADRYASAAREAMIAARDAVPAWIMPLREVIETIPPDPNSFDVVIIDEASQASIEALFLLWLAPRVIVVGDERQCAPSAVVRGELQPIFDRLDDYLSDIPEYLRLAFTPKSNLFSLLETKFSSVIRLREHFRCMPEIIGWSSREIYRDSPLVPLRQFGADRLPPLKSTYVSGAYIEGQGSRLRNDLEAQAIVEAILECNDNPAYFGKTFGVIVLQGFGQIRLIEQYLDEYLSPTDRERRKLRVGSAPDFQGDERDVMFLSMVIAERRNALAARDWQRRFNVAASRAKDQMWLFHSVTPDLLSPVDLRRSLLTYMLNPPAPQSVAGLSDLSWDSPLRQPFESKFEQRVYLQIRDRGYSVTPQFEVNGRFIDLVIMGAKGRLAVECDGDYWHSSPEDRERDIDRELELRRAGWKFWRILESEFYLDPIKSMESLWFLLEQRGIRPGDLGATETDYSIEQEWESIVLSSEEGLDGLEVEEFERAGMVGPKLGLSPHLRAIPGRSRISTHADIQGEPRNGVVSKSSHDAPAAQTTLGKPSIDSDFLMNGAAPTSAKEVRKWAKRRGLGLGDRGRIHPKIVETWNRENPDRPYYQE